MLHIALMGHMGKRERERIYNTFNNFKLVSWCNKVMQSLTICNLDAYFSICLTSWVELLWSVTEYAGSSWARFRTKVPIDVCLPWSPGDTRMLHRLLTLLKTCTIGGCVKFGWQDYFTDTVTLKSIPRYRLKQSHKLEGRSLLPFCHVPWCSKTTGSR